MVLMGNKKNIIKNLIKIIVFIGIVFAVIFFAKQKEENEQLRDYVEVEEETLSFAQYHFYESLILQKYKNKEIENNIDFSLPLETQVEESSGRTWREIIDQKVINFLKESYELQSELDFGEINSKNKEKSEEFLASLANKAAIEEMSVENYIKKEFGKKITQEDAVSYYLRYRNTKDFLEQTKEAIEIKREDIWNRYLEDKSLFDVVDFIKLTIPSGIEEGDSEEKIALKKETAEKIAQEIFDQIYDEKTLNDLAEKYNIPKERNEKITSAKKSSLEKTVANWLFEEGRKKNTLSVLKNEENGDCYIIFLIERYQNPDKYPSIYVANVPILEKDSFEKMAEESFLEEKFLDKLKEKEIFPEKYERVKRGMFTKDFDLWLFDPSRMPGDVRTFKKEESEEYIITYFIENSEMEAYKIDIENILKEEAHKEYLDEIYNRIKCKFIE